MLHITPNTTSSRWDRSTVYCLPRSKWCITAGVTPATTAITTYAYDEQGNKTSQTDALGRTTKWAYDSANRPISRTLPNGETETFTYDQIGNRTSHTDFTGKKTSYTYDVNGRILFATDSTGKTTGYLYTASGQVASSSDARGVTKYAYDAKDRLTRQDNPGGSYLAYAYDANGNITQRSTPAGTVSYAYDSLNRLTTVTAPSTGSGQAPGITSYTYDANGNRTKTVNANGTETNYTFDALNRLTQIEHRTTATQAILKGYAYTLKPNGQRASVREYDAAGTVKTRTYTYDSLNRLTQDVLADTRTPANSKTTTYTYGNTGNRATRVVTQGTTVTTTAYTYDADDRLTTETTQGATTSTTTYAWDANGNLSQKTEPTQITIYAWDGNNRLSSVQRGATAATATTVATYQYDAQGNRIAKTSTPAGGQAQTTTYLVDSNMAYAQVVQENTATAGTATPSTTNYLYGLERIQQTRAGQGTYYHGDGLNSTALLTDQTGAITDSYDYDDYGALQSKTGTTKNDFLYAGEQFDQEANLYYNRARYLDVNAGRFTGLDPYAGNLSQPITLNKYAYAGDDPINRVDPSGLMDLNQLEIGQIGGQQVGAGQAIAGRGAQVLANRAAGKAFENVVKQKLEQYIARHGGELFEQVYMKGPGGRRFADFVLKIGDRLIVIEAKTKMPFGGTALVRLAGQIRTYLNPSLISKAGAMITGDVAGVVVITEEGIIASEAAFASIAAQLETGAIGPVLSGSVELLGLLRNLLPGF